VAIVCRFGGTPVTDGQVKDFKGTDQVGVGDSLLLCYVLLRHVRGKQKTIDHPG
jgi:hypothetical protein